MNWVRMRRAGTWGPWHVQDDYSLGVRTECGKRLRGIDKAYHHGTEPPEHDRWCTLCADIAELREDPAI